MNRILQEHDNMKSSLATTFSQVTMSSYEPCSSNTLTGTFVLVTNTITSFLCPLRHMNTLIVFPCLLQKWPWPFLFKCVKHTRQFIYEIPSSRISKSIYTTSSLWHFSLMPIYGISTSALRLMHLHKVSHVPTCSVRFPWIQLSNSSTSVTSTIKSFFFRSRSCPQFLYPHIIIIGSFLHCRLPH